MLAPCRHLQQGLVSLQYCAFFHAGAAHTNRQHIVGECRVLASNLDENSRDQVIFDAEQCCTIVRHHTRDSEIWYVLAKHESICLGFG